MLALRARPAAARGLCCAARARAFSDTRSGVFPRQSAFTPLRSPQWHASAARPLVQAVAAANTFSGGGGEGAPTLTKAANNKLKACKSLTDLRDCLYIHAEVLDAICISTAWVRVGNICAANDEAAGWGSKPSPQRLADGRAFAREVLLGKTLKYLPVMDLRSVSNVLWGMGKVRLDLAAEGDVGQYLAAGVEEQLLELLQQAGLKDPRDVEQLWLGLRLCQYDWSNGLLRALTDASLEELVEWSCNVKCFTNTCQYMTAFLRIRKLPITQQQRAALAEAIRLVVSSPNSSQRELQLGCSNMLFAATELGCPLEPSAVKRLHDLALTLPLERVKVLGLRLTASNLVNATRAGYQPTAAEAQAWLQHFQDLTGRSSDTWTAEDYALVVGALSPCRSFSPPPHMVRRLRREVAALPAAKGREAEHAKFLRRANKAWGLAG